MKTSKYDQTIPKCQSLSPRSSGDFDLDFEASLRSTLGLLDLLLLRLLLLELLLLLRLLLPLLDLLPLDLDLLLLGDLDLK